MSLLVAALLTVLAAWMLLCAHCGFRRRVLLFFGVLLTGLTLNQVWMYVGLKAQPLEINAIMAQLSVALYGICAFGIGWLASRIARAWVESRVEGP